MKIKISNLIEIGIVICCFLMLGFTLLPTREVIGYYTARTLVVIFSILSATYILSITRNDMNFSPIRKILNRYFGIYSLILLFSFSFSLISYHYSFGDLFKIVTPYLYAYMAYAIAYVFYRKKGMERVMTRISYLVMLILLFKAIAWFKYNFQGTIVFERLLFEYDKWFRNGLQRVNAGYLVGIATVFLFCRCIGTVKSLFSKLCVIFIIFFLAWVSAYRFQLLVTLVTCFVMYYFYQGKNKVVFVRRILLIVIGVLILMSEPVQQIINSFAANSSGIGYSTLVRFMNIKHYWQILLDKSAIFGIGFIAKDNSAALTLMEYNGGQIYWLEDIGILGGFFRFGLLSFFMYGYIYKHAISTCLKMNHNNEKQRAIIFGITSYMIVSCLALNIFDGQRAFDVPFYIAIIAYMEGSFVINRRDRKKRSI